MGKKNHHKAKNAAAAVTESQQPKAHPKLSNKKLAEVNNLTDKLLRISTVPNSEKIQQAVDLQKEISQILDHLQLIESPLADSVDKRSVTTKMSAFAQWAQENGANFEDVEIADFEGYGRGLRLKRDIPKNSLAITVPRALMLTTESAKKSLLGSLIERDTMLQNMPNVTLSLHLLVEKFKGDSFWKPYIDVLPNSYNTVLYFSQEELLGLQGSQTFEIALKQIKNIARQYAYFYKLVWTSDEPACKVLREKFTYDQYRWAVSSVMTRQNSVPSEDGSQMINAFIPVWDFCNHTNGNITTDYNPVQHQSECWTLQDFKVNEQLFIFYGPRSNAELFIHNGFVYKNNPYDVYWLKLGISKFDASYDKRIELLKRLELPPNAEFQLKVGADPLEEKLLAFVRIYKMKDEQLDHWLQSGEKCLDLLHVDCALDTILENSVWNFLHARLQLLMSVYGDASRKPEEFKELSTAQQLVADMKASELSVLQGAVDYIQQRLKK